MHLITVKFKCEFIQVYILPITNQLVHLVL